MPIRIINIPVIYLTLDIGLENWFIYLFIFEDE